MASMIKWVIGAIVGVVLVIVTFIQIDPKTKTGDSGIPLTTSLAENTVEVKIEGQVAHPGTYTIRADSTISDLVSLAGGYLSSADLDALNDSLLIEGRTLVYVPMLSGYSQSCVIDPDAKKINVNTATAEELKEVNGISETLANRIVAYREENGEFHTLEELMNVVGIGTKTYEKIRDSLTLK